MATSEAVILAGGLGSRLEGVLGGTPKVLAPIGGRPFLDYLFDQLRRAGVERVVLALGHLADAVSAYLNENPPADLTVEAVTEPEPMGTAGALRFVRGRVLGDPVMVMNGDTFLDADLGDFMRSHEDSAAQGSLLCVEVEDVGRYGAVEVDSGSRLISFLEKGAATGPGLINGGVYIFSSSFLDALAAGEAASLERDVLEKCPAGALNVYVHRGDFIDIGTPESLVRAEGVVSRAGAAS